MLYLGVDLGGTNIKVALVDAQGNILQEASRPTNLPRTAEAVCDDIAALCLQLSAGPQRHRRRRGGLPRHGGRPQRAGAVLQQPCLGGFCDERLSGSRHRPARAPCQRRQRRRAGEALAGCAKGADSAVILTLGTGVGGGIVLGGKLLTGYTGAAAEPGHMVICDTKDAPLCTCGRRGDLESYASATALIRMTREAMQAHPESALWRLAGPDTVEGRTVFDARDAGDAVAAAVVGQYIHHLAVGIANLVNIFFPEVVGLSGGVANQGEALLAPLRAEYEPMVFGAAYAEKKTRLVSCTLGYRAGVIGAALLAAQE